MLIKFTFSLSSRIEEHSAEIAKMLSSRDKLCEERKKTRKLLSTAIAKVQAQSSEASEREGNFLISFKLFTFQKKLI